MCILLIVVTDIGLGGVGFNSLNKNVLLMAHGLTGEKQRVLGREVRLSNLGCDRNSMCSLLCGCITPGKCTSAVL